MVNPDNENQHVPLSACHKHYPEYSFTGLDQGLQLETIHRDFYYPCMASEG